MGNCSPSRLDQYSSVYFDVFNVDASLFKHSKGQIQITNSELILHQNNQTDKIKWPLNGVRRYGYYKDIFLFESGRKCSTGEGLFAFKCNKAKRLNEVLHKIILNNASNLIQSNSTNGMPSSGGSIASTINNMHVGPPKPLRTPEDSTATALESTRFVSSLENVENIQNCNEKQHSSSATANSPYYVNELVVDLKKHNLPLNLSTVEIGDKPNRKNTEYINFGQVDDLNDLAKIMNDSSLHAQSKSKLSQYSSNSILSKTLNYEKLKGALSSSSSRLNYIIVSSKNRNPMAPSSAAIGDKDKSKNLTRVSESEPNDTENSIYDLKNKTSETPIEYCAIDFTKTKAIPVSSQVMKQRRMDYKQLISNTSNKT